MGASGEPDDRDTLGREEDAGFDASISDLPISGNDHLARLPLWSARRTAFTPRQRLLRLVTIVVAFALALTVISWSVGLPPFARVAPPAATSASPEPSMPAGPAILGYGEKVCLRDAAWSPDSRRIAVLVESPTCTLDVYQPGSVRLYDVSQQRTTVSFALDPAIFAALGVAPPPAATPTPSSAVPTARPWQSPTIFHHSVVWSRDGSELAVAFLAILTFAPNEEDVSGVALLSSDGAHERVLLGPRGGSVTGGLIQWDLTSGVLANVAPSTSVSTGYFGPLGLPPALAYGWGQDDTLKPLNAKVQLGDPIGDAAFSVWQPGQVYAITPPPESDIPSPPAYVFVTSFTAWSPDGRSLLSDASTAVRLSPAGVPLPTQQALQWMGIAQLPVTPPQPCLQGAIDTMDASGPQSTIDVAWRSDSLVLALSTDGNSVAVYECTTGRKIASARSLWPSNNVIGLGWSPDGAWLLLPNGAILAASQLGS